MYCFIHDYVRQHKASSAYRRDFFIKVNTESNRNPRKSACSFLFKQQTKADVFPDTLSNVVFRGDSD